MNGTDGAVRITNPPGFHWFGYYDKLQFSPDDRYVLGMRTDFEHRLYTEHDTVRIGMIDLAEGNKWTDLGESRAWSWQQGCMLQWRPGSDREIVWNDRENGQFVSRVFDIGTRTYRTLPKPIGAISPCGRYALCEDYSRIWQFRPGYAYAGIPDPYAAEPAPAASGVWRMDMETGAVRKIVSLPDLAAIPYSGQKPDDRHYVNHLAWNPSGERFLMFNRWPGACQPTRVFTAAGDGSDLRLLSAHGASHWTWRDAEHALIWAEGAYRLFRDDGSGEPIETVWEHPNGHHSYVPGTHDEWLLADTYPLGASGRQELCLFHIPTRTKISLGEFAVPPAYRDEWRSDLHPRLNRSATLTTFDSPHEGVGRQMYAADIRQAIGRHMASLPESP